MASRVDVGQRLSAVDLPERLTRLGFRDEDRADGLTAIKAVLDRADDLAEISGWAERLIDRIGDCRPVDGETDWVFPPDRTQSRGSGVLPMLALVVTAPEVAAFHTSRGISAEVSTATLADLGQQVWVHRLTYGEFGLHTQGWLTTAWSGALYWLGRLQFNLQLDELLNQGGPDDRPEWVLSTHIPRSGPLTPDSVDAALATARDFFSKHFPDYPTGDFYCQSWLLDPALAEALPDSNLAAFQQRWQLYGEPLPGEVDLLFFIFLRRPPADLTNLPTNTRLRRAAAAALAAGQSWSIYRGRLPQ